MERVRVEGLSWADFISLEDDPLRFLEELKFYKLAILQFYLSDKSMTKDYEKKEVMDDLEKPGIILVPVISFLGLSPGKTTM